MPSLNLLRKVKIDGQWMLLPVVRNRSEAGRLWHDLTRVLHAGKPTVVLAGNFYLEYREGGRRVRRVIGDNPREVKAAIATQTSVLDLRKRGVEVDDAPQLRPRMQPQGKTIRTVVDAFIQAPPLEYRPKSFSKYRNALKSFTAWTKKTHVVEIGRDDIKAFTAALVREYKLDTSTAVDKAVIVAKIMRDAGAPIVMKKGDWPKITKPRPEIYRPEQLKRLFAAAAAEAERDDSKDDYLRFQLFLLSGFREMEAAHLTWPDFDEDRSTLTVAKKRGFDPKTYEERVVPIPTLLVELLKKHRARQRRRAGDEEIYILATSRTHNKRKGAPGGQADQAMLDKLKSLAYRSGLNCGRCRGRYLGKEKSCAAAPICRMWGLHKFRHTYATTLLREGVDLKSLQMLLGHKDMKSTEKYLRALEPDDLLEKINRTNLATRFV